MPTPDIKLKELSSKKLQDLITALNSSIGLGVKVQIIKNDQQFLQKFIDTGVLQRFIKDPQLLPYVNTPDTDTKYQQEATPAQPQKTQFYPLPVEQLKPSQGLNPISPVPAPVQQEQQNQAVQQI